MQKIPQMEEVLQTVVPVISDSTSAISEAPLPETNQVELKNDTKTIPIERKAQSVKEITIKEPEIIISGSPASEGIARGIVKVIKQIEDFVSLNKGDILVVDKITPDYVLWMRKAGGIITNVGGMTSHAAVISREYGIACIVGTENATQILRNGDFVEVNGSSGRVYKLDGKLMHELENHVKIERVSPTLQDGLHVAYQDNEIKHTPVIPIIIPQYEVLEKLAVKVSAPSLITAQTAIKDKIDEEEENINEMQNFIVDDKEFMPQVAIYDEAEEKQAAEKLTALKNESLLKENAYHKSIKTATKIYINMNDLENANALSETSRSIYRRGRY